MESMTLTEAKAKFSEVVERAMAGEEIIVTKMGKPAVKLVPCESDAYTRRIGFAEGKGEVIGDFNEWPEDIARILGIID